MKQSNIQCYQSLQDAHIFMGNWGGKGRENPNTPLFINFSAVPCNGPAGEPAGDEVDLCIALTHRQVAEIVKAFFWDIIMYPKNNVFGQFLNRLLKKRWAIMTSDVAKDSSSDNPWYEVMHYTEIP